MKKPSAIYSVIFYCANIILGILAIGSIAPIMMSPMMFDAPGSTSHVLLVAAVIVLALFPLIFIASLIVSIVLKTQSMHRAAAYVSLAPLVNILLFCSVFYALGR